MDSTAHAIATMDLSAQARIDEAVRDMQHRGAREQGLDLSLMTNTVNSAPERPPLTLADVVKMTESLNAEQRAVRSAYERLNAGMRSDRVREALEANAAAARIAAANVAASEELSRRIIENNPFLQAMGGLGREEPRQPPGPRPGRGDAKMPRTRAEVIEAALAVQRAGFVPMSGTTPAPLALSREPARHAASAFPARAMR